MKIIRYITIALLLASVVSCSKWLDVYPKSEISREKVFETEDGFYSVLAGLYGKMSSDKLYGFDLTCGYMDLMGGSVYMALGQAANVNVNTYWNHPTNGPMLVQAMFPTLNYYRGGAIRISQTDATLMGWWRGLYSIIVNSNMLIEELEKSEPGMFESGAKELMLGEALALRAYCHLDLVRIFQTPYLSQSGKTDKRIPYMDKLDGLQFIPSATTDQILDKVDADLVRATQMMKDVDPISSTKRYITPMFTTDRRYKMNYYAAKLLQARSLHYRQKDSEAYEAAMEVINGMSTSGAHFITQAERAILDDARAAVNRSCPMENLFAVTNDELSENFKAILVMSNPRLGNFARPMANKWLSNNSFTNQPSGFFSSPGDIRISLWGKSQNANWGDPAGVIIGKYVRESKSPADLAKYPKQAATLLKIGEAYLIAAEAAIEAVSPAEAKRLLNELQTVRNGGVFDQTDKEALKEEMLKEFRRETLGDGQLFFFYKRRNEPRLHTLFPMTAGGAQFYYDMNNDRYTPSTPDDEFYNGRTY